MVRQMSSTGLKLRKVRVKSLGLLVLWSVSLISCSSSSSKSDEILSTKLSRANELVIAVDNAIAKSDYDVGAALSELWTLCDESRAFTDGLTGDSGWEYPGDIPEKYADAFWTPGISCYLHDALKEGSIAKFAEYVGPFRKGYACIRTGTCE